MNTYNDKFIVVGGNELNGTTTIQTCKNSVLPILAGCVLCDKPIEIKNVPNILDVNNMFNILTDQYHISLKKVIVGGY